MLSLAYRTHFYISIRLKQISQIQKWTQMSKNNENKSAKSDQSINSPQWSRWVFGLSFVTADQNRTITWWYIEQEHQQQPRNYCNKFHYYRYDVRTDTSTYMNVHTHGCTFILILIVYFFVYSIVKQSAHLVMYKQYWCVMSSMDKKFILNSNLLWNRA